ncbi:hypothetical protein FB567DRAFT_554114 [Paraphoma chrysanthemicola]|uniref:Uncharacterized protein n=1 Tax=Paraphoma chrysanthemicola TaxID=798071 RepID=A0A8K0QWS4_9PLEO|nr:hypothetical protein FB567DRAFT_554114 [Paraphoma chrysanthemicola]
MSQSSSSTTQLKGLLPETYRHASAHEKACTGEIPKVIVKNSYFAALLSVRVHVPSVTITAFLIEVVIVSSLTAIIVDLLRYHLLHDGLRLDFLGSGFSLAYPTWLRSVFTTGRGSSSRSNSPRAPSRGRYVLSLALNIIRSQSILLICLVGLTGLANTVGPASALLFQPIQLWRKVSSTNFYLNGLEDDLWPSNLTQNHTGPTQCASSPLHMEFNPCLHASWRVLLGGLTTLNPIRPAFDFSIPGASAFFYPPGAVIKGNIAMPEYNYTNGDPDTWAVGPDLGVTSHLAYLGEETVTAFNVATGWRRRLRDFVESRLVLTTPGKFPVVRTLCAVRIEMTNSVTKLRVPVVNENQFWRARVVHGTGPSVDIDLKDLNLSDWDAFHISEGTTLQYRAKWLPLPAEIGNGSAVMVMLMQHSPRTYASVCVIDARWAEGQTIQSDRAFMWSWESQPGYQEFDPLSSLPEWHFERTSMFDPRYAPHYSRPISVQQPWLDALAPQMPEASIPGTGLVMNTFEALLNQSGHFRASSRDVEYGNTMLEYITTLFFLNALSRIGLTHQLEPNNPSSTSLRPEFANKRNFDDGFVGGKDLYEQKNASEPYTRAYYEQYRFGTAWAFKSAGQYISMAILGLHVILALAHSVVLCWSRRSSKAWASVNELIVLAYNSATRPRPFKNCSSGIERPRTLKTKVRIGTRVVGDGIVQAELVVCGDEGEVGDVVPGKAYS